MREVSATVTVGKGSEKHNHDVEFRQQLEHVRGTEEDVIELIPYVDYEEQINALMQPYIEEHNERIVAKYQAAWDRYNAGEIRSKPKAKDYKMMSYDYYKEHKDDFMNLPRNGKIEKIPIYRSMILGIGDQNDRQNISRDEAVRIFENTLKQFREDFPKFHVLGATIHADECGFWHCHLDFKALYERETDRGLKVGVGLDAALERMGYVPEQSIVNGRDKIPLLFNAMRNQIYREMETAMAAEGVRLQYGVTERKDPGKNGGKNQRLEVWQETQDIARELQHNKNIAMDILEKDEVSPEDLKEALQATLNITDKIDEIESSPRKRIDKNKMLVEFRLFDQLRSFVEKLTERIGVFLRDRDEYKEKYEALKREKEGCVMVDKFEHAHQRQRLDVAERQNRNFRAFLHTKGMNEPQIDNIAAGRENSPHTEAISQTTEEKTK